MLKHLLLVRPLAVIDLETTGTRPGVDRIIEISVLKLLPDGESIHKTRRLNPGIAIPADATRVHGISDAAVAEMPTFDRVAAGLLEFIDGCDLCGYNLQRFDLPMLLAEFTRAGRDLCLTGRAIIDPLAIFHEREKRSLGAAVRFYLNRDHDGAHAAEADVIATVAVLDAMLERYDDLPRDVPTLHELLRDPDEVDVSGKFRRVNGEICFRFGSYKGKSLQAVLVEAPDYLQWILASDFPNDTKAVVRTAIQASVTASSGSDFDDQGPLS